MLGLELFLYLLCCRDVGVFVNIISI